MIVGRERYRASRVRVVSGVLRVDDVFATVAVLSADGVVLQGSGFVHGRGLQQETPAYVQEAAANGPVIAAQRSNLCWQRPGKL